MGTRASQGFTIIETVLFLGVTGLLVLGVLVGVGSNVNVQRYRDASESFKNLIQSQYSSVLNVQNGRQQELVCTTAAGVANDPSGEPVGQSDCVIVGKYTRIERGEVQTYTVLARERSGVTPSDNTDITALREKYALNISRAEVTEKSMEWGTEIARPIEGGVTTGRTPRSLGLLIVRSPESGQVYTFTSDTVPTSTYINDLSPSTIPAFLTDMLVAGNATPGQAAQVVCIESSGLFDVGQVALYINAYAASSSAIEVLSNETMQSRGMDTSC